MIQVHDVNKIDQEVYNNPVDGCIVECVLKSNAGYYVGKASYYEDCNCWEPYSRISGYYKTKEEAVKAMHNMSYVYSI